MRLDPTTGRLRSDPVRLEGTRDFVLACPVGAAGRLYVKGRHGTTVVLRQDADNAWPPVSRLDDSSSASAALGGRELFLRGGQFMYSLAEARD